jgi:hypothetical protein
VPLPGCSPAALAVQHSPVHWLVHVLRYCSVTRGDRH